MRRLGSLNMADPSPHPLVEALFYSHPSIQRRLAFCEALVEQANSTAARQGDSE
jgi:Zn-dependent protease with chaperone function